jgi:hypothetical protein
MNGASSFNATCHASLSVCVLGAPLAIFTGTQAEQGWDKGETSLDSPPILRPAASFPLRRWRI